MIITPIKTHIITQKDTDIFVILDKYLPILREKSVVAVTSKIISFTQGRVVSGTDEKQKLIEKEAQYFLPLENSKYDVRFTINKGILTANAGIDESNANNKYVLWPKDLQKTANGIREYLAKKSNLKKIGVVITDSKATPLRWGVTGMALSHSGFNALKDYIGTKDLFKREFKFEKLNIADSLAAAAVLAMGEGAEQTPIAVIEKASLVEFQERNPTQEELDNLRIKLEDDLYAPLITSLKWQKGKK